MDKEEGKHASSLQWILYKNLTFIHRIPLDSREWFHAQQHGDGIKSQFVGSISKLRMMKDWYLGKQFPIPSYFTTRCQQFA